MLNYKLVKWIYTLNIYIYLYIIFINHLILIIKI